MKQFIDCLLSNIEYDMIEKNYVFKNVNLQMPYNQHIIKFKINSDIKQNSNITLTHSQFQLYTKFVKFIIIMIDGKKKKISNIHPDGFLVSFDLNSNILDIEINFFPINPDAKIFIKNQIVNIYKTIDMCKISWDNIFVINLKRRIDRKLQMIKNFKSNNINKYEFIEAFDGTDISIINKFYDLKKNYKSQIINTGHYGCLLSHIKSIELAKSRKYKSVMILEDDIKICDNFIDRINEIKIPPYHMIYLGGIIDKKKLFFSHWAQDVKNILGAYGYILTADLYDYVLEKLKKMTDYVDLFYMKNIQQNYSVVLLDDLIKTNLDTSDTSGKSQIMTRKLSYIKPHTHL